MDEYNKVYADFLKCEDAEEKKLLLEDLKFIVDIFPECKSKYQAIMELKSGVPLMNIPPATNISVLEQSLKQLKDAEECSSDTLLELKLQREKLMNIKNVLNAANDDLAISKKLVRKMK